VGAGDNTVQLGNTSVTNVNTSGTYTGSGFKTPTGNSSQYLKADGSIDSTTYLTAAGTATNVSGVVAIANGGTGASTAVAALTNLGAAPINSPTFTGVPTAPTATPGTNTTQLATTAFVTNAVTTATSGAFVDLTTNQTVAGGKYFTNNISSNGVSIGVPGTGSQNTMLGAVSFGYASPGSNNTGLGFFTLASLNGGDDNTAVGTNAIRQGGAANGSRNTAVGSAALSNGSGPNDNSALGYATLAVTSGSSNTAVGSSALQSNTTASYNVGVGFETLRNTTTGGSNTAVGRGAMYSNTSGDVNTAVGESALVSNTNGRYNTSIGVQAQEQNTTGQSNTAIGVAAIDRNAAGNNNAVLGAFAGRYIADNSTFNTAIDNSVLIGALSRPLGNNANNEIVIGYNAIGKGSNTIQLGNTSVTNVNTSGALTTGNITYPTSAGSTGQVLTADGSGAATWATPSASPKFVRSFTQTFNNFVNCTAQSEVTIGNLTFSIAPTSAANGAGVYLVVKSSTSGDYQCISNLGNGNTDQRLFSVSTTNQNVSNLVLNYYNTLTSTIFNYYHDANHSYEVKVAMDGGQSVLLVVTYY
jgi:hypothetical protein